MIFLDINPKYLIASVAIPERRQQLIIPLDKIAYLKINTQKDYIEGIFCVVSGNEFTIRFANIEQVNRFFEVY
jgi:hydroxymethylglutaryl-CoA reductase